MNQTRVIAFRFPWATKTCRVEIEGPACSKEDVLRAVAEGRARVLAALADGRVTESEFEAFDQQTHEAMTALAELRDRLRGMVAPESTMRRVR